MPGYKITIKVGGTDETLEANEYLVANHSLSTRPGTLPKLKDTLVQLLEAAIAEPTDEAQEAMRPWFEAVDALDDDSFFPVHLGPTPDDKTILVENFSAPDASKVLANIAEYLAAVNPDGEDDVDELHIFFHRIQNMIAMHVLDERADIEWRSLNG